MVFSSTFFILLFIPLFFLCYYVTPNRFRNIIALIFSIIFYAWGAPKFVFVLLASIIANFYLVAWMNNSEKRKKKILLAASVVLNVGMLLYFKYANFFIDNLKAILESFGGSAITWTKVMLPIGISFFTFQSLTYSVDVYRGVHTPLKKAYDYVLYIMLFPQMIAGPIVRFNEIADQIVGRKAIYQDRILGWNRFILGLSKKVLIANPLGAFVDGSLNVDSWGFGTGQAWLIIFAYSMQIYFDFSGYSDMAIGLGRMMGFHFPENFNNPYVSRSITEFWRRWHITLGEWMRDYLYIPLGGNKVNSQSRLYFNLIFVFLISGFWHGASWNFLIWGAFHGAFLILDRLFLAKILDASGRFISTIFTFFVVMIGWIFFRVEDFDKAILFIKKMFGLYSIEGVLDSLPNELPLLLLLAAFFAFFTFFKVGERVQIRWFCDYGSSLQLSIVSITVGLLLVLNIAYLSASGFNPFIYFRF